MPIRSPYIPDYITVHLGRPSSDAENVTITFPEYIKNVACSEIYPTWPTAALQANIYCQISFALNRIFTEWYRSQGYAFDITSSTAYDQYFIKGRNFFNSIVEVVDEIFNNYLRRPGFINPLFAQYCNGTTVTCDGLSQWGSVGLALDDYTSYEILTYYYGDDLEIAYNTPVQQNIPSFSGTALRLGDTGTEVRRLQIQLNRVAQNFPNVPRVAVDGIFGPLTEESIKVFQRTFDLDPDGVVGPATWYRLNYIYVSVKNLAELISEGLRNEELGRTPLPTDL